MAPFLLALRQRDLIAERTMAFHFGKPAGFRFRAGQAVDLTLLTPPETDPEGDTRTFTLASAPHDDDIVIATRLRDTAFKRVLTSIPLGTSVQAEGPAGTFILHEEAGIPAVFLTGGIGITPFRSMIRDALARRLRHQLWLFYSNTRPEDAAFLDEFQHLADTTPSLHFVPTMTDMSKSQQPWHGERTLIDGEMVSRRLTMSGPRYYVAGPPSMVTAMRAMLAAARVADADIRTEEFAGY